MCLYPRPSAVEHLDNVDVHAVLKPHPKQNEPKIEIHAFFVPSYAYRLYTDVHLKP